MAFRSLRPAPPALSAVLAATFCGGAVVAHEIGTMRVSAHLEATSYRIEIGADPVTLLNRLEADAGVPRSGLSLAPDEYRVRIESLREQLVRHVDVRFDDRPVQPGSVSVHSGPAASNREEAGIPPVTIGLAGDIPAGARTFTWRSSLTSTAYAFSVIHRQTEPSVTVWLEGAAASAPIQLMAPASAHSRAQVIKEYVVLGFTHIVPRGLDHILFVVGLFLFSRRLRALLAQVTAFTVAHSITLGLSLYGVVSLRSSIVEPLIAASLAYVAIENMVATRLRTSRIALVFGFGLLHGLGFAGALTEAGVPRSDLLAGLFAFNCGVEAGQLTVVGLAYVLAAYWRSTEDLFRDTVVVPGSALIAIAGLYWTVVRLL